jgi:hypothetical protein
MVTRKRLKLDKHVNGAVREWFSFVDKRTNVDSRICKKLLATAEADLDITQTEAQILMRWYLLVPTIAKDKIDDAIYSILEQFIKHEKDGD